MTASEEVAPQWRQRLADAGMRRLAELLDAEADAEHWSADSHVGIR